MLGLLALALPAALAAQATPASGIFPVPRPVFAGRVPSEYSQASPAAAALAGGGFAVVWTASSDPVVSLDVVGRLLTADGEPARGFFVHGSRERQMRAPVVAADGAGGFTVAWPQTGFDGHELWVRRFAERARPRGPAAPLPTVGAVSRLEPALAVNPAGAYALAWLEDHGFREDEPAVHTQGFVPQGLPVGLEVEIELPAVEGRPPGPAVGLDGLGRRVVAWIGSGTLWGQRLALDGSPLGSRFAIGSSGGWGTALAMAVDGSWTVAWDGPPAAPAAGTGGASHPLLLRRYAPDGSPLGPPAAAGPTAGFASPVLSADRHGNFVLAWLEGRNLTAHLFNRALVPQGAAIQVSRPASGPSTDTIGAALGEDGRLLLVWAASSAAFGEPPRGRLWQARRDADVCAFRGTFLCDTGNDGGAAEETLAFGLRGDVPLLGDLDGDGRDDPCVYRNGRFLCDARQDGGGAEARVRFSASFPGAGGAPSRPFLGDLDGDGRDDPCVRRGNRFLCDLDRDGAADLDLALGDSRDPGLLGDVDGDGDDDPCFYAREGLHCDTAHDGLPPDWTVSLAGRIPAGFSPRAHLLGDVDGDGRDDLCLAPFAPLAPTGRLLCWLKLENGAVAGPAVESAFAFASPDATLLLGDVDRF